MQLMQETLPAELTWQQRGVSIGQINAELERLRGRAIRLAGAGRWPEVRTRVLNLVVHASGGLAERALEVVDELPGAHPSRAVFVRPLHDREGDGMDARLDLRSC